MARKIQDSTPALSSATALEKASSFAALFFVMLGVCVRLLGMGAVTGYGGNLLVEMFIVVGAAFWAMELVLAGRMAWLRSRLNLVIAIFFALSLVSAFRAPHLQKSLPTLIDWISCLLVFFLVIQFGISRKSAGLFMYALIACAAVLSIYAIFQYYYSLDKIAEQLEVDPGAMLRKMDQPMSAYGELLSRVKDKRAFATFANPNSFAGFLLMTIPLSVGILIDTCRGRRKASLWECAAAFLAAALQAYALVLTFSKGGFVTILIMAVVFAIMVSWRAIRGHKKLLVTVAVAAVLVVAGVSAAAIHHARSVDTEHPSRLADKLGGAAESMRVRIAYWRAGLKMIADHPLLGVGLDNFGSHYSLYKLPTGREVERAHNNYVQVAAEAGVPGLIVFCLLWGGLVGASVPRQRLVHETRRNHAALYLSGAAGACAFIAACFLLGSLETFSASSVYSAIALIVMLGLWLLIFAPGAAGSVAGVGMISGADGERSNLAFTRLGICMGLIGFLIHGTVDFDLYVPGCSQTAWMLGALALVLGEQRPEERIVTVRPGARWSIALGAVALCAVLIAPGAGIVARSFNAETLLAMAKQERNKEPVTTENLIDAIRLCERSLRANPLDDSTQYLLAQCYEAIWQLEGGRDDPAFHQAVYHFREAVKLYPAHSAALNRISMAYRDAGIYEKRLLLQRIPHGSSDLNTIQLARQRLKEAPPVEQLSLDRDAVTTTFIPYIWAAAEAVGSYPTNARFRASLGEALHLAGLKAAAAVQYAKALEYDRLADIERLKLPEETRRIAEKRASELRARAF